jgi:hypothetical protein
MPLSDRSSYPLSTNLAPFEVASPNNASGSMARRLTQRRMSQFHPIRRFGPVSVRAASGQNQRFPPPRLNGRCRIRERSFSTCD